VADPSKDNLLRSWKEISAHLGVEVRTCHRWETRYGMPVHRAEGQGARSPVFAYKDELDRWFRGTFKNGHPEEPKAGRRGRPWLKLAIAATAVLVLGGGYLLFRDKLVRRQPADFRIEGSFFICLDKDGRELWRRDMGVEDLQSDQFYHASFQYPHQNSVLPLPLLIMRDIDADGDVEVLFPLCRVRSASGEGTLFCFDRRGTELWRYEADRTLICGSKVYSPDYRIYGLHVHDINGDGKLETLVESYQAPDWPCELAMLDSEGKTIGEFWNAGQLKGLAFQDIDGDGREELIICGVNNEYRGGCLIVFDTRDIHGGSPQSGEYVCKDIEPGTMLYYLTTPLTDVAQAKGNWVEVLNWIDITKNGSIQVMDLNSLIYDFNQSFRCFQVTLGHVYLSAHEELLKEGKLTSVLDEAYKKALIDGIRYWDGTGWTAEPTMVKR
jgi:hypothetical protein